MSDNLPKIKFRVRPIKAMKTMENRQVSHEQNLEESIDSPEEINSNEKGENNHE